MRLYRLGGNFLKLDFSYSLEPVEDGRLNSALVDYASIDALDRLIGGGLQHSNDLIAAELALKGIIFHDNVKVIAPAAKVQIYRRGSNEPFVTSLYPQTASPKSFGTLNDDIQLSVVLGGVAQLFAFPEDESPEFLEIYNSRAAERHNEQRRKEAALGLPEPDLDLDAETAPLEFVAESPDDFFANKLAQNPAMLKSFLLPISRSGAAAYIGLEAARRTGEAARGQDAEQFFSPLEKSWLEHLHLLRRTLDIPIPLFLAIVLQRASSRDHIPGVIVEMRSEFAAARRTLWELFDEADLRIYDTKVSARILRDIEGDAASVVPRAFGTSEDSFPLRFDLIGRALELIALGNVKPIGEWLFKAGWKRWSRLDAANLVEEQLKSVELRGLLERVISEEERMSLIRSS